MATSSIPVRKFFPRVKEAREAMQAKAATAVMLYFKTIKAAMRAGDHETAMKSLQWYMEHVAVEDGTRLIDPSVDKGQEGNGGGNHGPIINVGIALGGLTAPKELPPAEPEMKVIDVEPEPDK